MSKQLFNARIVLFVLLLSAVPAMANTVEFEFTGFIDKIEANTNNALPDIYIDQTFQGWFSYSSVPDGFPDDGSYGTYHQNASISTILGTSNLTYLNDYLYIRVKNQSEDSFRFGVDADASNGEFNFTSYGIYLTDSTGTVFDSDALPTSLDLTNFDSVIFHLRGYAYPNFDWFDVDGQITSLTLIPEPATFLLFSIGCLALRRRKRA